jgi:hypothetical protein
MKIHFFLSAVIGLGGMTYPMKLLGGQLIGAWGWQPIEPGERWRWRIWITMWDVKTSRNYLKTVFSNVVQPQLLRYARRSLIASVLREAAKSPDSPEPEEFPEEPE